MSAHRYILQPYKGMSSRHTCPGCGKKKTFTRYIDTITGYEIDEIAGRCNREVNCGYHLTVKQFSQSNNAELVSHRPESSLPTRHRQKQCSYIPSDLFQKSLSVNYIDRNNLVQFLIRAFNVETTISVIRKYNVGTSRHWNGATVFWQVDSIGRIRAGKVMLYNPDSGRRVRHPFNHLTWAHKALKLQDFNLNQCLFGEHLLATNRSSTVAVVESEKTAIISSIYFPEFIWVACGSLTNLTKERCQALAGRRVVLFPDLNGFDKWSERSKNIGAGVVVSDLLEKNATEEERVHGLDLADYLLRYRPEQIALTNIHQRSLKEAFKQEFLAGEELNEAQQRALLQQYTTKGLKPAEAKEVFQELITEYSFSIQ